MSNGEGGVTGLGSIRVRAGASEIWGAKLLFSASECFEVLENAIEARDTQLVQILGVVYVLNEKIKKASAKLDLPLCPTVVEGSHLR
jgi:hypothetical protein